MDGTKNRRAGHIDAQLTVFSFSEGLSRTVEDISKIAFLFPGQGAQYPGMG